MSGSFFDRAELTCKMLENRFRLPGTSYYYERVQPLPTDRKVSELWPYSGVVSAYNALAAHPLFGSRFQEPLRRVLAGLEAYYDVTAYDSYILAEGGAQKYFDDNEWLGIEFIRAYRTLKDATLLQKAVAMFSYAVSGWSEAMGGGIYWRENDPDTKNTCSNGPAAVLGLLLYEETHDPVYLDWVIKILDWVEQLRSPLLGVYLDAIKLDGAIDERTFTYNSGTPLHANALLFKITGNVQYLQKATDLAEASYLHFGHIQPSFNQRILPNTPWFNAVLFRGYLEFFKVDPAHNPIYLHFFKSNLDYAWNHARAADQTFSPDWSGQTDLDNPIRWLLDQAAMVELFALLDDSADLV
jgi:hypothetical protein